jgi:hypothetical protein
MAEDEDAARKSARAYSGLNRSAEGGTTQIVAFVIGTILTFVVGALVILFLLLQPPGPR